MIRTKTLGQVLLMDLRRPFASVQGQLAIMFVLTLFGVGAARQYLAPPGKVGSWASVFMAVLVLLAMLAIHLKDMFASPSARLLPGFRRAHLSVMGAWLAVLLLAAPVALNVPHPALAKWAAVFMILCTLTVWWVLVHPPSLPMMLVMLWVALSLPAGGRVMDRLLTEATVFEAMMLLGVVAALAVLGLVRLVTLHEEMPEYHRRMSGDLWRSHGAGTGPQPRPSENLSDKVIERHLSRLPKAGRGGIWARARRWGNGAPLWPVAPLIAVVLGILLLFRSGDPIFLLRAGPGIVLMPAFITCVAKTKQLLLEFNLLRPVSRPALMREMGLNLAVDLGRLWLAVVGGWLLAIFYWAPHELLTPAMLRFLFVSTFAQVFLFSIIIWLARYRRPLLILAPIAFMLLVMRQPIFFQRPSAVVQTTAIILALLGLLIARDAYRRWLVTELG